jgi:hypothetical protein
LEALVEGLAKTVGEAAMVLEGVRLPPAGGPEALRAGVRVETGVRVTVSDTDVVLVPLSVVVGLGELVAVFCPTAMLGVVVALGLELEEPPPPFPPLPARVSVTVTVDVEVPLLLVRAETLNVLPGVVEAVVQAVEEAEE